MDPGDPVGTVTAVAAPLFLCLPLECPPEGEYAPMGFCTLMINIGLGSIAPMLPLLEIFGDPVVKIADLPGLPGKLPSLPFLGLDIPPLPFPDPIGIQGTLEFPSWPGVDIPGIPALFDLIFGVLTIPLDMCLGLCELKVPDLSLDGMMGLLIPALMLPGVEAPMLPTLGLLDLAICIILLILLPFLLLVMVIKAVIPDDDVLAEPILAALGPIGALAAMDPEAMKEEFEDKDKVRAAAEKALDKVIKEEEAEKAAKRKAAQKGVVIEEEPEGEWKPSIKDYYYG